MTRVTNVRVIIAAVLLIAAPACVVQRPRSDIQTADPLPSWNDGPVKHGVIDFVSRVTKEGGPDFVPEVDRIVTTDNDGTLWAEKPMPNEVYFVLARIETLLARNPALARTQPYKAVVEKDLAY